MASTGSDDPQRLPLHEERLSVGKVAAQSRVRVSVVTRTREEAAYGTLDADEVDIERISINREVDTAPPVRTEGETTIIPVLEERVTIQRRLVLVEEVRVRKRTTSRDWSERIPVRYQDVVVERFQDVEPGISAGVEEAPTDLEQNDG